MSVLTAAIALTPTTALINQTVNAIVTVSNSSGGGNLSLTSLEVVAVPTGGTPGNSVSFNSGDVNLGPAAANSIAPSASVTYPVSMNFFAPSTGPIGTGTGTFSVGAIITSADGQVFSPTAATLTVNPLPLPTAQQ
jgi:hypothetical protein